MAEVGRAAGALGQSLVGCEQVNKAINHVAKFLSWGMLARQEDQEGFLDLLLAN